MMIGIVMSIPIITTKTKTATTMTRPASSNVPASVAESAVDAMKTNNTSST